MCKYLFPLAASLLVFTLGHAKEPETKVENVSAKEAKSLLDDPAKKIVVLDVRTPSEFKAGHLSKAKLIDFKAAGFDKEIAKLDKTETYLVHCRSCLLYTSDAADDTQFV